MSMTRINVRLSDVQKAKIAQAAAREGVTISAYVTGAALGLADGGEAKAAALEIVSIGFDAVSERMDALESRADERDAAFFKRLNDGFTALIAHFEKMAGGRV